MRMFRVWAVVAIAVLIGIGAGGCRRYDYRTVKIDVPGMKNKACSERVYQAVYQELGQSQALPPKNGVEVNLSERVVKVTYDSLRLSLKNIEFAIADAGFAANDIPANPEGVKKLPPECR